MLPNQPGEHARNSVHLPLSSQGVCLSSGNRYRPKPTVIAHGQNPRAVGVSQLIEQRPNREPAANTVAAGLSGVLELFLGNQLKIFKNLASFWQEFRLYRRDEKGKIVKENDHLMDCLRYAIMSGRDRMCTEPVKRNVIYSEGGALGRLLGGTYNPGPAVSSQRLHSASKKPRIGLVVCLRQTIFEALHTIHQPSEARAVFEHGEHQEYNHPLPPGDRIEPVHH